MNNRIFDCVIVANGNFPTGIIPVSYLEQSKYIIACDGAIVNLELNGYMADAIIGDLDSIDDARRGSYGNRIHHNPDQETNDLTKAVGFAHLKGFRSIIILGATGLREDHTLGNISLLLNYMPMFDSIMMVSDFGTFIPFGKSTGFDSEAGQQVSIFALPPLKPITTHNLRYPILNRELELWWEGTLNETLSEKFSIEFEGEARMMVYLKHNI